MLRIRRFRAPLFEIGSCEQQREFQQRPMEEQVAAGGVGGKSELGVPIAEAVMEQPKLE